MDVELRKDDGQKQLADFRKQKPPKKSPILQILQGEKNGEADKQEEQMLDAIGCTSNVMYIDSKEKKIYVANAGDSRCTMCRGGKAVEMSIDHKPES